jgi:NAD(P)-dependent dehydrogenase (short-subunit alcohol dehydrogenase family)
MGHSTTRASAQRREGVIVNNASVGGLVGLRGHTAYSASKHAVVGLTRSAAADSARSGIRINAICPGVIATPLNEDLLADVGDKAVAGLPMRRFGQPEEIAEAVVWLLSGRASFVLGSALAVDGGYTAISGTRARGLRLAPLDPSVLPAVRDPRLKEMAWRTVPDRLADRRVRADER